MEINLELRNLEVFKYFHRNEFLSEKGKNEYIARLLEELKNGKEN